MSASGRVLGATFACTVAFSALAARPALAAPPAPTGAHPRLFLDPATLAQLKADAAMKGSVTAKAVATCDNAIAHPDAWTSADYEGFNWVEALSACLVAYEVRGDAASAHAAIVYWRALLDDYNTIGDGAGGDTVVQHDDGYAMRTFAPYSALAYDWLHDAPGVDDGLRGHALERFGAWTTWYDANGYNNSEAGANYHAGYAFAEAMIAVAEGGEAGGAGDAVWGHVVDDIFGKQIAGALASGGVLDGGDWLEGWQYGALSVAEYALAARALRDNGAPITGFGSWEAQLAARTAFALTPDKSGGYIGGDSETTTPNAPLIADPVWAILVDAAPDPARAWAAQWIKDLALDDSSFPLIGALAEARMPAAQPFPANAATYYIAPGSRTLYARSDWSASATWMVSQCASRRVSDHMFNDAGNVVLARGADQLIVDPTPYGGFSTLSGNGPTVSSPHFPPEYQPGQGWWGTDQTVDFTWARQTASGVIAARCDYDGQFRFQDMPSDIQSATRDLVLIPNQGGATLVLVDDIQGADTSRPMMLRLRSPSQFSGGGGTWTATVGSSDLVVQSPFATSGAPTTDTPPTGDCSQATRGNCPVARFAVGEWALSVPAAHAQAITIADAVATGTNPGAATTSSGTSWRAVEMDRGGTHLAVVAVDAGASSVTYTAAPGTHVVVGAPAGSSGNADVTATANGAACDVTITPHDGAGGVSAQPVVVMIDAGCGVTEDQGTAPFAPPEGTDPPPGSSIGDGGGGCCQAGRPGDAVAPMLLIGVAALLRRRRCRP